MKKYKFNHLEISGIIFDLDGVITNTASLHKIAWKISFDKYLKKISKKKFVNKDYYNFIDGKPRLKAINDYLDYRKIYKNKELINLINKEKNILFRGLLKKKKILIFQDIFKILKQIKKYNIKTAVASSSKNCKYILKKINFLQKFDYVIDGKFLEANKLKGKPNSTIFSIVLKKLSLNKKKTIILEDSSFGVLAAKRSGVKFVIGVARKSNAKELKEFGAKIVVKSINQIEII